jgi:hypothetical protein
MTDALDLGAFDEPILVFGGPYGNLQATRALLAEAERRRIPPSRMLCTGDVVAYCADPQATVDLIRGAGIAVVAGNCEESLGIAAETCGCGFTPGSACDLLSAQWFAYADRALDNDAKAWMRGLPRRTTFTLAGRRLAAVHGGVEQINRYVFPTSPALRPALYRGGAGQAVAQRRRHRPAGQRRHAAGLVFDPDTRARRNHSRAPRARLRPAAGRGGDARAGPAGGLRRCSRERPLARRRHHAGGGPPGPGTPTVASVGPLAARLIYDDEAGRRMTTCMTAYGWHGASWALHAVSSGLLSSA